MREETAIKLAEMIVKIAESKNKIIKGLLGLIIASTTAIICTILTVYRHSVSKKCVCLFVYGFFDNIIQQTNATTN